MIDDINWWWEAMMSNNADDNVVDNIKWCNLASSKELKLMIVNRRETVKIKAKQGPY